MFIYLISNLFNGKCYIGQTIQSVDHRFRNHISYAKHGRGCRALRSAIAKYGESAFTVNILAECKSKEQLDCLERLWISILNSCDPSIGYNLSIGGETRSRGSKWSAESRAKLSHKLLGNKRCLGRKHSEEAKAKISASLMGHPQKPNSGSFKKGHNLMNRWPKKMPTLHL